MICLSRKIYFKLTTRCILDKNNYPCPEEFAEIGVYTILSPYPTRNYKTMDKTA
jgi:hypothetical protein